MVRDVIKGTGKREWLGAGLGWGCDKREWLEEWSEEWSRSCKGSFQVSVACYK